jgi:starvation-inducible DNA-binding protein
MKKFQAFLQEEVEPNLGVYDEVTDKAKHGLGKLLADLHVAFIKVHNFHWNVIGPFFGPLHALFDSVYGHLGEHIDKVAERIRAIGGVAPGSMKEYLEMATLTEERGESRPTHEMLSKLVADLEHLSRTGRQLAGEVDGDEGTMNLLADFVEQIDKDAWFVRTHLND